jgi:hypothetical protein
MDLNSSRDFDTGLYRQVKTPLNADFTYAMSNAVGLAFGAGDSASFTTSIFANQGFTSLAMVSLV